MGPGTARNQEHRLSALDQVSPRNRHWVDVCGRKDQLASLAPTKGEPRGLDAGGSRRVAKGAGQRKVRSVHRWNRGAKGKRERPASERS